MKRVKRRAVRVVQQGAVVVVTNQRLGWVGVLLIVIIGRSSAGVLPEERTDILQHRYSGDGVTITGPSVLVRKNMNNKIAFSGHYYVDRISGATVDVRTYGSPYAEERTETSVGTDIIHNKTSWHVNVVQSDENDYQAKNTSLEINQSFFGDLSTLSLGVAQGWDTVMDRITKEELGEVDRQSYRLGWSQVITPKLIGNMGFEAISDEGYLKNQYRQVRYLDAANFYAFEPEKYPNTRTSYAAAIGAMQYLNANHVLGYRYRYFTDNWDIKAHTLEFEYRYQWNQWLWVSQFRAYRQGAAEFYADIFPYSNYQEFKARDKELSQYQAYGLSVGATYVLPKSPWDFVEKSTLNIFIDHLNVDYDNFYDATITDNGQRIAADQQPLFHLSANAIRVFFSVWY
jgi:hypothetical protein